MRWYYRPLCDVIPGGSAMIKLRWYYPSPSIFVQLGSIFSFCWYFVGLKLWKNIFFKVHNKLYFVLSTRESNRCLLQTFYCLYFIQFQVFVLCFSYPSLICLQTVSPTQYVRTTHVKYLGLSVVAKWTYGVDPTKLWFFRFSDFRC